MIYLSVFERYYFDFLKHLATCLIVWRRDLINWSKQLYIPSAANSNYPDQILSTSDPGMECGRFYPFLWIEELV